MNDQELIAEARRAGAELRRRPGDLDRLAGTLLAEMADRLDGDDPAPVTGYLVDGKLWHPSDVTIIRQGAAQATEADTPPL